MLEPGDRVGDWIAERRLGEGGMGSVFRCHNAMSDRIHAAVKILKPDRLDDARGRFIREVEALYGLRHPGVVRVTGWGEDDERGLLWIAMELVEGEDLEQRLHRGRLTVADARAVFVQVARGLAHAHDRGVYHRDLKPANILVGTDGHGVLIDFGIAVQANRTRLTQAGLAIGTPSYMPPEVFDGAIDPARGDVYALGQVLYEALTGDLAFPLPDGLSPSQQVARMMTSKTATGPLDPGGTYPEGLRQAIRDATHPEARRRTSTMAAFAEALEAGFSGAPALPSAPSVQRALDTLPLVDDGGDVAAGEPAPARTGSVLWLGLALGAVLLVVIGAGVGIVVAAGGVVWSLSPTGPVASDDEMHAPLHRPTEAATPPGLRESDGDEVAEIDAPDPRLPDEEAGIRVELPPRPLAPTRVAEGDYRVEAGGLKIYDIVRGTGAMVKSTDKVKVHYVGWLPDGTVFDSSRTRGTPSEFTLDTGVIEGWSQGVPGMRVGGLRQLVIPPELGYGDRARSKIPAGSTLTFEVEVVEIVTPPVADQEEAANELYTKAQSLADLGDVEGALRLLGELERDYAGARASRTASRLRTELEVVGKPFGELQVEKWYQGGVTIAPEDTVLLLFFESWCPHCKREMPRVQELHAQFARRGLVTVGLTKVTRSSTDDAVRAFIAEAGARFPVAKERDGNVSADLAVSGIPAAAVVKGGKVIWRGHPARLDAEKIAAFLRS